MNRAVARFTDLRWLLFALPVGLAAWSAQAIVTSYLPTPFNDYWDIVGWWKILSNGGPLWGWMISQHNEHRIFFPRLIFLADLKWFQGREILDLIVIGLIQLLAIALYVKIAVAERLKLVGLAGLVLAISLTVSLTQWENLFWAFQVQFVGVYVAAGWALYLFVAATEDRTTIDGARMAGALALLVIATFNMANGVLAGVAMVLVALITRRSRSAVVVPAIVTAALLAIYLRHYHHGADSSNTALALHHPGRYLTYLTTYLGNVWSHNDTTFAQIAGLFGVVLSALMAWTAFRHRGFGRGRATLFGVVIFVGLTAAVTSLGRLHLGADQALASRYMTPTCHFWAAQALFWTLTAQQWTSRSSQLALGGVLTCACLGLIPIQKSSEGQLMWAHGRILLGSSALLSGADDEAALHALYPDLALIRDIEPFLRQKRLSIFADGPVIRVGERLQAPIMPPAHLCRGAFDLLTLSGAAAEAQGWGWDLHAHSAFDRIILTDGDKLVVGVGLSGLERLDVEKAVREVRSASSGWTGSVAHGMAQEVVAYGLLSDGRVCELGRKPWPQ